MEDLTKKPCVLVIRMQDQLQTQQNILKLLLERGISVSSLHLQCLDDSKGILIVHCLIEKDRIRYCVTQLEKIKGVIEMEVLK